MAAADEVIIIFDSPLAVSGVMARRPSSAPPPRFPVSDASPAPEPGANLVRSNCPCERSVMRKRHAARRRRASSIDGQRSARFDLPFRNWNGAISATRNSDEKGGRFAAASTLGVGCGEDRQTFSSAR
jgi:hypothetical protein